MTYRGCFSGNWSSIENTAPVLCASGLALLSALYTGLTFLRGRKTAGKITFETALSCAFVLWFVLRENDWRKLHRITDDKTGHKYPLADYALLPNMAIIDTDLMMSAPKGLTAASGLDCMVHDLEALASVMATDFTDGLALKALKIIFEYLPRAYDNGPNDPEAREKMANAATMAGMAFANAFLGVSHSLAHKLGAYHHIPHGIANALVIEDVLRFNAAETPAKMGTFPQYDHPHTLERYAEVADYLGLGGKTPKDKLGKLITAIRELRHKIGIKDTIADYGISEETFMATLDEMTENAFDDQCTGANPRYPLLSEIKQIYLNAYYGRTFTEKEYPKA